MILSNEVKELIYKEYNGFKDRMYGGKTLEQRRELDAFFTPPEITIPMIEKFDCDDLSEKNILDPTSGSGNLLAACFIAGADADKVYGNDYDAEMVRICRKRLKELCESLGKKGFRHYQIHRGNALQKRCVNEFSEHYQTHYKEEFIDDLDYAQGKYSWDEENKQALERLQIKNSAKEELW